MIRSRIGNTLLLVLGLTLIVYSITNWSFEAVRQGRFVLQDLSLTFSSLVLAGVGAWCTAGAISNLRSKKKEITPALSRKLAILNLCLIPATGLVAFIFVKLFGWNLATWVAYEVFLMSFTVFPLVTVFYVRSRHEKSVGGDEKLPL